ncbi:MAG: TlpA disulfide reductase family protein [Candidatus Methylomirabilota bacterium]
MGEVQTFGRVVRRLVPAGMCALCLLGVLAPIIMSTAPARAGQTQPAKAPELSGRDTLGVQRNLSDYLGKKPLLLEFMSLGCPYCLEMAPVLARVHAAYGDRVQFLTVVFDPDAKRIQQFAAAEKHTWPYLVGAPPIIDAYKLKGVPAMFFLTRDGRILHNHAGLLPEKELREHLDSLLKAK